MNRLHRILSEMWSIVKSSQERKGDAHYEYDLLLRKVNRFVNMGFSMFFTVRRYMAARSLIPWNILVVF